MEPSFFQILSFWFGSLSGSLRFIRLGLRPFFGFALAIACWGSPLTADTVWAAQDPSSAPIQVVGRLDLKLSAEEQQSFEQATLDLAAVTRSKDSVIIYSCNRDIEHPGSYVFVEAWPSQAALEAHLKTDHFLRWWEGVKPYLAQALDVEVAPLDAFHPL